MAHVLFAWELGSGYGHLRQMLPIADDLAARGHSITVVSRNPRGAQALMGDRGFDILRSPLLLDALEPDSFADSYAEVLLRGGYATARDLGAMLRSWLDGFASLAPDLIVADFAPTAMLAARCAGVPVASVGDGYRLPPRTRPLPFARAWEDVAAGRLAELEERALTTINACLPELGGRPLTALADLFEAAAEFLCCFPELDHYLGRGEAAYYGPIYDLTAGAEPDWPPGPGERIFVYANVRNPAFPALVAALDRLGLPTVLHASDLQPGQPTAPTRSIRLSFRPVRLETALATCSLVVCHGLGTTSAALVAGRPVLMLPENLEQCMLLHRVASQGLGLGVGTDCSVGDVESALRRLLGQPSFAQHAARFAARYDGYSPTLAATAVAEECAALPACGGREIATR